MSYRYLVVLIITMLFFRPAIAQDSKFAMRFIDEKTQKPLATTTIIDKYGNHIASTDTAAYAVLPLALLQSQGYIVALCQGYQPDTIRKAGDTAYMRRLAVMLNESVVRGGTVSKLLHAPNEYVVDYDFVGDRILTATYSGENGGHAKLFLLDNDGNIITSCKVPGTPVAIYKSCVGRYYCICDDKFFPVSINDSDVSLLKPYDIRLLTGLQQCELSVDGNLYYKLTSRQQFKVQYSMLKKGDSLYKPIKSFEDQDEAQVSFEECLEIQALLSSYQFSAAARKQFARLKFDKGAFARIDMPMMIQNDTLAIFDFFSRKIVEYSLDGNALCSTPISFAWKHSQQFNVLTDRVTGTIYLHHYDKPEGQTITVLNLHDGTEANEWTNIKKPFAEDVKINNGIIYFLWQDKHSPATRQLFMQSEGRLLSKK